MSKELKKGARFIYESQEVVDAREEKMWEENDEYMKGMMAATPVEVKAGKIDGKQVVEKMSLAQLHVLEQLAIKLITDDAIFQTLPTSFYKKIVKAYLIKLWLKIRDSLGLRRYR